MAFTYDPSDLGTDTASGRLNTVRFLVGDTTETTANLQDEEIIFLLAQGSDNVYLSASYAALTIASKVAELVNTEVEGQLKEDLSDLYKHYLKLSTQLKQLGFNISGTGMQIKAGGISITKINQGREDLDRNQPSFYKGQFEGKYSPFTQFPEE